MNRAAAMEFEASSQQLGPIDGAMKKHTAESTIGVKLPAIFFCGACALFLVVLILNGTLQGPWMFATGPCVMAVVYYIWKVNFRQPTAIDGAMKRISNPFTPAMKITPFLVCGFSAFILALLFKNGGLQKAPVLIVFPCVVAVGGYYAWKASIRDLMDEVYDCGDYLLVKKGGQEDTVLLSNINYVRFSNARGGAQPRIRLSLDAPGKFGAEILFAPLQNPFAPRTNGVADDLVARVNKARSACVL
jgi:hypothetical protein